LGKRFGVQKTAICRILSGYSWRHLRETPEPR
jgi:hypothetical protein